MTLKAGNSPQILMKPIPLENAICYCESEATVALTLIAHSDPYRELF